MLSAILLPWVLILSLGSLAEAQVGGGGSLPKELQAVNADVVYASAYGAKCDGSTDDTAALSAFFASFHSNMNAILPAGQCIFKSALAMTSNLTNVSFRGSTTRLTYAGSSTTTNMLTLGQTVNGCSLNHWVLQDFYVDSTTTMTNGLALTINDMCASTMRNVGAGDINQANTLWNGVYLHGGNSITWDGCPGMEALLEAVIISGDSSVQMTGPQLQGACYVIGATIGLNIGGNVGGITIPDWDFLENQTNVKISQDFIAVPNLQVFFGSVAALDITTGGANLDLDIADAGSANSLLMLSGTWVASSLGDCVKFETGVQWRVTISGGVVLNCHGDAIKNLSANVILNDVGTTIWLNTGYGIDNSGSGTVNKCAIAFTANTLGNTNGTVGSSC